MAEISVPLNLRVRQWTGTNLTELRNWISPVFPDVTLEASGPDLYIREGGILALAASSDVRPLTAGGDVILCPLGVFTIKEGVLEKFM